MEFQHLGMEGWFAVLLSGILGNWLVGMAAFLATAARTVSGMILGVLFPIIAFVAIGAQHSPANMGYFSSDEAGPHGGARQDHPRTGG